MLEMPTFLSPLADRSESWEEGWRVVDAARSAQLSAIEKFKTTVLAEILPFVWRSSGHRIISAHAPLSDVNKAGIRRCKFGGRTMS